MIGLKKCWFPAARSKDLKVKPISFEVLGVQLMAFRQSSGLPVILENRCPHRGIKLSEGRVVDGCIMCPYHGWRFNSKGRCVRIPSLCPEDDMPDISVRSYPVREKQGTIWFSFSEDPYTAEPPDWRYLDAKGFMSVLDVSCNYIRIMENLVDNPHAGYIHAGLLRREPTTKVVADIVETPLSIFIQTKGDNMNNSLLYKLFGKKGEEVRHIEEYLAPNQMVSTYNQSGNIAALQSFCVPVDHHRTRWFFRISLRFGHASRLLFPVFKAMVYRIVVQDQRIAERADAQDQLFPHAPMHSTKADAPSTLVAHSAKAFATNGPTDAFRERRRTVNYML